MSHQLWTVLHNYRISPNQVYFLDCCRSKIKPSTLLINPTVEEMIAKTKGFIDDKGSLTFLGLSLLNEFETYLVKTKTKISSLVLGDDFIKNVNQYLDLFPKKRLPSGLYARQSIKEITEKFIWFFKNYPEYDWETILDATDYYIYIKKSQDIPYKFMMTSSYFIKKSDPYTKEIKSVLADTCQEVLENPDLNNFVN